MEQIRRLSYREGVRLDQRRLEELYHRLGAAGAEEFVCRALEEIAVRLTYAEKLYRRGELAELRKCLRALTASAERIGMVALSRVAGDVRGCIDRGDAVATAATLSRLARTGEGSLSAIWDLQEFTI